MKKWITLCVVLTMLMGLAAPALAAEDLNPPLWQQYGYDSREACVEDWFGGDADAYQDRVDGKLERQRWEETTMAGAIAAFDADAYWDSGDCSYSWYYDSKEDFMESWLLDTEAQFQDAMLEDWLDGEWTAYQRSTLVARTRAELGGVSGQVGVMLDGAYIPFPDAAPEVKDGYTMAPCRPVLEAFGGTVRREGGDVVCALNGAVYRFTAGSDQAAVTAADGTASTLDLGAACYEKNGSTYLPVRPLAEALGCDVLWDPVFQTAVLLRRDALAAELDQNFTVLNRMFAAMVLDPEKNYRTAVQMDAKLKLLDSINGDKTYSMDADLELLQSGTVLNLTMHMDLSALLSLPELTEGLSPVELTALRSGLRNLKVQMIYDGAGGMAYFKMPLLSLLSEGKLPADSWLSTPVAPLDQKYLDGPVTVGALLYANVLTMDDLRYGTCYYYESTAPVLLCRDMRAAAETAASYLGDGCFQDSGGYSVLHYGEEEYNAYLEAEYGEGSADYFSDFEQLDLELKIAQSGAAAFRVLVQSKGGAFYEPVVLVDAKGTASAAKVDMNWLMKVKNQMELELTYTGTTDPTREEPLTAPPAGQTVIDPETLYGQEAVPAPAA